MGIQIFDDSATCGDDDTVCKNLNTVRGLLPNLAHLGRTRVSAWVGDFEPEAELCLGEKSLRSQYGQVDDLSPNQDYRCCSSLLRVGGAILPSFNWEGDLEGFRSLPSRLPARGLQAWLSRQGFPFEQLQGTPWALPLLEAIWPTFLSNQVESLGRITAYTRHGMPWRSLLAAVKRQGLGWLDALPWLPEEGISALGQKGLAVLESFSQALLRDGVYRGLLDTLLAKGQPLTATLLAAYQRFDEASALFVVGGETCESPFDGLISEGYVAVQTRSPELMATHCRAINSHYGNNICAANGTYSGSVSSGSLQAWLVSQKEIPVGIIMIQAHMVYDWAFEHRNRESEDPILAKFRWAWPLSVAQEQNPETRARARWSWNSRHLWYEMRRCSALEIRARLDDLYQKSMT